MTVSGPGPIATLAAGVTVGHDPLPAEALQVGEVADCRPAAEAVARAVDDRPGDRMRAGVLQRAPRVDLARIREHVVGAGADEAGEHADLHRRLGAGDR